MTQSYYNNPEQAVFIANKKPRTDFMTPELAINSKQAANPSELTRYGLLLPAISCVLFSLSFWPFLCDDTLISLRYVNHLIQGEGLTWTAGKAVEGYSNIAWILLIALPGLAGMDLILATRLISALLMLSVLLANFFYWRPFLVQKKQRRYFYLAQFAFAFNATTGVWLIGGLEQPLIAACIAWALFFLLRYLATDRILYLLSASSLLGILCLTRPDSPLICLTLALGLFILRGFNWQTFVKCCILAIFPLLCVTGQMLFRLSYYGEWLPNTALIKVQPSLSTWLMGLLYVAAGLLFMLPLSYYAMRTLTVLHHNTQHRALAVLVLVTVPIWLIYLMFIGGDIFPAFRHFTVVVVLLIFCLPGVCDYFHQNPSTWEPRRKGLIIVGILYILIQWFNPGSALARGHNWVWQGQVLAKMFHTGWPGKQPLIAVDAAGSLPYFTDYPSIDMLGLNDYFIARQPPDPNIHYTGHQFGDGHYVFNQQPDLIDFCFPSGTEKPCWSSGHTLYGMKAFHETYQPVQFQPATGPLATFWIRVDSEQTGIKQTAGQWSIPAYLLQNGDTLTTTYLNRHHQFSVDLVSSQYLNHIPPIENILSIELVPANALIKTQLVKQADGHWQLILTNRSPQAQSLTRIIIKTR